MPNPTPVAAFNPTESQRLQACGQDGGPQLVCLAGAECTGKTTLAQQLADYFAALWVPERLRAFCNTEGRTPRREEQWHILQAQSGAQEAALAQARRDGQRFVFCDTSALLTAIYSDHYFSDSALLAPAYALHAHFALTLLLVPDLPWVQDGVQRDGINVQNTIHTRLLHELQTQRFPFVKIGGQGERRFQRAAAAVHLLAQAQWGLPPDATTPHYNAQLTGGVRCKAG